MTFFNSDLVKKEIKEIENLQSEVFRQFCNFDKLSSEKKINHIKTLKDLIYKQKIFYTRLSLSEDSNAINRKKELKAALSEVDIMHVFNNLEKLIDEMEKSI